MSLPRQLFPFGAGVTLVAAGLGALATIGSPASAATSPGGTTASATVASSITLSGLTPSFALSGVPGDTATKAAGTTMKVTTNSTTGYTVTVQAADAAMAGATSGNTDAIPIANLGVKNSAASTYTALSNTAPVTVTTKNAKSATAGDTVTNDFQLTVPFVNADTYSVALNYVAATK